MRATARLTLSQCHSSTIKILQGSELIRYDTLMQWLSSEIKLRGTSALVATIW